MEPIAHETELHQRVRLKANGEDGVYPFAFAGSEGWVRKQKIDEGYPMVFIEWDKDHWTYNSEPDRWTYDAHFEPVKEVQMSQPDPEQFESFMRFMFDKFQQEHPQPESPGEAVDVEKEDALTEYNEMLGKAIAAASEADSFMLFAVHREEQENGVPVLLPTIYNSYQSKEAGLLLESQLSRVAMMSHQERTLEAIERHLEAKRD